MSETLYRRKKVAMWVAAITLVAWMLLVTTGMRIPYLYGASTFAIRAYLVFPILVAALAYFSFIYKDRYKRLGIYYGWSANTSWTKKIKIISASGVGMLLMAAFVAWTSASLTAWLSMLVAVDPVSYRCRVTAIKTQSGPVWSTRFDLRLAELSSGNIMTLPLTRARYEKLQLKNGHVICITGRTTVFGTIVDTIVVDGDGSARVVCGSAGQ